MAETGPPIPSELERDARRAIWAAIIGTVIFVVGVVLVVTNFVIYVGSWPEVRPLYFSGIGVVLIFMGIIAAIAGLIMSQLFRKETISQPEVNGRQS